MVSALGISAVFPHTLVGSYPVEAGMSISGHSSLVHGLMYIQPASDLYTTFSRKYDFLISLHNSHRPKKLLEIQINQLSQTCITGREWWVFLGPLWAYFHVQNLALCPGPGGDVYAGHGGLDEADDSPDDGAIEIDDDEVYGD
ncbi:hypothetical protein B0H11DRAFT_2199463 [Mycena galericulata]|nr:hypothetical protein B0H11DRAFT_2199463 [Mycena galericulata]